MEDDRIGFMLGDYDTNKPLTIDPLLIYLLKRFPIDGVGDHLKVN